MGQISNNDKARTQAYAIERGIPVSNTDNLPTRIAVLAEMNHANQSTPLTPTQITTLAQCATLYGAGSPMWIMLSIILANVSVPVWAYPQVEAGSAAANSQSITITGTATANVTHTVLVSGRGFIGNTTYDINIVTNDTPTQIGVKMFNAINACYGSPITTTKSAGVVTTLANWRGITSQDITINVLTNGNAGGVAYAIAEVAAGSGLPSVAAAITSFSDDWNTIVASGYGILNTSANTLYNSGNGNANLKTARWDPLLMKPAVYIVGDVTDTTTTSADTVITDALKDEMTIAVAPAPMSLGLPMEAAANYAVNFANICDTSPNTDIQDMPLVDMPRPLAGNIPAQTSNYTMRNALVKLGMSTVIYKNDTGTYRPQDFLSTYHPVGEVNPTWMYPRDIMIDLNIRYKFTNLQTRVILNKQIAKDDDNVSAANVVKPKNVKVALIQLANDLVDQGFITDAAFMIASISVVINATNKNRFDISFSYDRSGVVRVISNVATAF